MSGPGHDVETERGRRRANFLPRQLVAFVTSRPLGRLKFVPGWQQEIPSGLLRIVAKVIGGRITKDNGG